VQELGFPTFKEIRRCDVLSDGERLHKTVYLQLRDEVSRHMTEGNENPQLQLSSPPRGAYRWRQPMAVVQQQLQEMAHLDTEEANLPSQEYADL
jgi:hypothetical protein